MIKSKYCILFLTFIIVLYISITAVKHVTFASNDNTVCIYLDAGHGGFDGGAASYNKVTLEKDICMEITSVLGEYFKKSGFVVLYTRTTDKALGKNKKTDIYKRVDLINKSDCDIYLSIHANAYPSSSVKGAQTFYSERNDDNLQLADSIMSYLKLLDNTNKRVAKSIKGKYLIDNVNCVGCLVEVGFLTNEIDLANLKDPKYISNLALYIYMGVMDYLEVKK